MSRRDSISEYAPQQFGHLGLGVMVAGILWYVAWSRVSGEKVRLGLILGDLPPVWLQRGRRIKIRRKKSALSE